SSDSLPESVGSSATHGIIAPPLGAPAVAPVMDSESDPFEDPPTLASDAKNIKDPPNSEPFLDRVAPANSAASDSNVDPHASPATSY
ncbi:hypothetical protein Tco_0609622, partial [Tanacetum coccineum]